MYQAWLRKGILFVAVFSVSAMVLAQTPITENTLEDYNQYVFRHPDVAYKELLAMESGVPLLPTSHQIWYFIRKAQAENTLGAYDEIDETLITLKGFREDFNDTQAAMADYLVAVRTHKLGDPAGAETILTAALPQVNVASHAELHTLIVREIGYVQALQGNYYDANLTLHNAYRAFGSLNNLFINGLIEESLGDTYNYSGNYAQSVVYYTSALNNFASLEYKPFIASTLLGLAIVNRRLKNWDEALTLFSQYEEALQFSKDFSAQYYLHYGRAMTLAEKGDCSAALPAIKRALSLRVSGLKDYDAELHKKAALCFAQNGDLASARDALKRAKAIFNEMPSLDGTQWVLELDYVDAVIALENGNFEQGADAIQEYYQALIALMRDNYSDRLARIQSSLETERKDKEIQYLKQQSQLQAAQSQAQSLRVQQQTLLLIIAAILAALFLVFAILQYRNSQKSLALSIRDELTGLHNRRYCDDYFKHIISNGSGHNGDLCLITIDIDDFKHINDSYGHQTGDCVLKQVAQIAAATLRSNDMISRMGGDEFIVVLPRTALSTAKEIAQRFLTSVAEHQFETYEGETVKVTVSLGIASYNQETNDFCDMEVLLEKADRALYRAKREGKNQFAVARL